MADKSSYRAGTLNLRPCPFCRGPATLAQMPSASSWWRVRCDNYDCGGTTWAMDEPQTAVDAWNRRPDDEA